MLRRLLNLALVLLLAPAIFAFTYEGSLYVASVFTFAATIWFLAGAAASLLVYVVFLDNKIAFIEVLLHEFEHAAVAFLFTFRLPTRMEIDPQKVSHVVVPDAGGCLRRLAPYYLPLLTIPLLLLKAAVDLVFALLKAPLSPYVAVVMNLLIGATLVFHLICTVKEYGTFQTDIKKTGIIASLVGVLFLNIMFVILCVAVVTGSYAEVWAAIKAGLGTSVEAYKTVLEFSKTHLLPGLGELAESINNRFCENCTPAP
jgi:hypothetical protein